jgi:hypothetical protein
MSELPAATIPCPACGVGRTRPDFCDNCSAVYGERHRCPHCQRIERVDRSRHWRWICASCGRPRLTPDLEQCQDEHQNELLRHAYRVAWKKALVWVSALLFTAGYALYAVGAGVIAVLILRRDGRLHPEDVWLFVGTTVAYAIYASVAWIGWKRFARQHADSFDRVWAELAAQVRERAARPLEAEELAGQLRIDQADARKVLASLPETRSTGYREPPPFARARVAEPSASGTDIHTESERIDARAAEDEAATLEAQAPPARRGERR